MLLIPSFFFLFVSLLDGKVWSYGFCSFIREVFHFGCCRLFDTLEFLKNGFQPLSVARIVCDFEPLKDLAKLIHCTKYGPFIAGEVTVLFFSISCNQFNEFWCTLIIVEQLGLFWVDIGKFSICDRSIFKTMANFGLFSGTKPIESVTVSFRLPYYTQWGQSLLVCGSGPLLGSWSVKKGLLLSPVHEGEELIWYGTIAVPNGFQCEYSYYVVDDEKNILRWEMGKKRKLLLPVGIPHGERVELRDLWQVLFSFSCFVCLFILFFYVRVCVPSDWSLLRSRECQSCSHLIQASYVIFLVQRIST